MKDNKLFLYGHTFIVEKDDKIWKVSSEKYYLKVCESKTKKEVIELAKYILKVQGKEGLEKALDRARNRIVKNRMFDYLQPQFKKIFGFNCPKCGISYAFNSKAIDAITFDKLINTPDGTSTYDYVTEKYGINAKRILEKLI
jgi:hypothetical protein